MPDIRAARQQMNIFQRLGHNIQKFYLETVSELKKVSWPTRQEATNLTTIVLIVIGAMSLFLGLLDILFTRLFALFLG